MNNQNSIIIHPNLRNFVKPADHAEFSPSSAERWWGGCSYSIQASKDIWLPSSSYAEEGTTAHAMCEAIFREKELGIPVPNALFLECASKGYDDIDMVQAGNDYYDICKHWLNDKEKVGEILWFGQERGIPVFPEKGCYGTGDFIIVGTKAAVVIDFKYGKKPVPATSKQLKVYAAGIARHLDNMPDDYNFFVVVHQPRSNPSIKEGVYTRTEMFNALSSIWQSLLAAEQKGLEPIEGSHCFWCPARRTTDLNKRCKAIVDKPLKLAQENFSKFLADSNIMVSSATDKAKRDEAIIKLMTLLPAIKSVVEQSQDDFMRRIEAGEHIPGVTVQKKLGRRELNAESDEDAAAMIVDMFPTVNPWEVVSKTKIKSLSKLEKEVGKGNLDPICKKKVTKEIVILDEKQKQILSNMEQFAKSISMS